MKYIKQKRKNHDDYYYQRADRCKCSELAGTDFDECMYCAMKSKRLSDYLKENVEDFWDERHLRGLTKATWNKKIKEGLKVENIF